MQEVNQGAGSPKAAKSPTKLIVVLMVAVIVVLVGVIAYPKAKDAMDKKKADKETVYHAVFLSNGQVYFGKLDNPDARYVKLSQVYYLQLNQEQGQQVQPAEGDTQSEQKTADQKPEFSLVKLGQELHGPEDQMVINKEHILFYEILKGDSNVVKAIKENKEKEEKDKENKDKE